MSAQFYEPLLAAAGAIGFGWKVVDWFRNGPDHWPGGEMWGPLDRKVWFWGGAVGFSLMAFGCAIMAIVSIIAATGPTFYGG